MSLYMIHLPSELTPFDGSDPRDESLRWPTELIVSKCIHNMEAGQSFEYGGCFRRSEGEQPVFDAIFRNNLGHFLHLSVSKLEELAPEISFCDIDSKGHTQLLEVSTTDGRTSCLGFGTMKQRVHHVVFHFCGCPDLPVERPGFT